MNCNTKLMIWFVHAHTMMKKLVPIGQRDQPNKPSGECPLFRAACFRIACACGWFCAIYFSATWSTQAQLDPEPRQLLHLGVNQSLHNDGPQAHYLFYYWNVPDFPSTNQVLRLVIAPTYLDGELGLKGVLGENTDLGLGVFGGGFAFNY